MAEIIPDKQLADFIDAGLAVGSIDAVCRPCPHCNYPVRYPKMVSEEDAARMAKLLALAEEYIQDKGIAAKLIAEVLAKAHIAAIGADSKKGGRT